ncbi:hypothetical protein [Paenibacillus xylanexedens]|uniref:hypothetical protein n=1 Tax=Paenibacillus xylanexedens TaxID=528191 RepID=UPI0011A021F7|nr:hypothetical protein [Paenibacillus xylanexedens]
MYEGVTMRERDVMDVGEGWWRESGRVKKEEVEVGDVMRFEGKIMKKKVRGKAVGYKMKNGWKIEKEG